MNRLRNRVAGCALGLATAAFPAGAAAPATAASLEECIAVAMTSNPDVLAASHRADAAREAIREARSACYPVVSVAGTYARTDNPPQAFMMRLNQRALNLAEPAFDPNRPEDTENLRGSVALTYRLLDGGQRGLGVAVSRLGAEAQEAARTAVHNDLVYQVTRAYYSALQAQAFTRVREETVKSLEESLRVARERLKAGSAVQTDVLNLEVQRAQAREDLISTQHGFQLAVAALNTAIGQDIIPEKPLPERRIRKLPPPEEPDPDAVENRPEAKAARLNAEISEKAFLRTRRDFFPVVSAFGSADWDSDASSDFEQSYFAGATAEFDVFTGFRRGAASRAAQSRLLAARNEVQQTMNELRLDMRQADLHARDAWERLGVARRSVQSAEEALRITRERYRQGAADIAELLTAQVGLTATRTRTVAAYYDYLAARANVRRARGERAQDGDREAGDSNAVEGTP